MSTAASPGAALPILGVVHGKPGFGVPSRACDCHVHVFGPSSRYPFAESRIYTPGDASPAELEAMLAAIGLERVVIVQPSPYGTDNTCTLDGLARFGERSRAVAVIGAATTDAELRRMHDLGVRGVRLNLETAGQRDPAAIAPLLQRAARRVAPLGWHVQTYTNLGVLSALAGMIRALPVTLVVDHFGSARAASGVGQQGFDVLLSLVGEGRAYVKLSAAHRISEHADCADAAPLARALIAANPERVLWGSDWPHCAARRQPGWTRESIEPFDPIDDGPALGRLAGWVRSEAQLRLILVDNPARLYGFQEPATP
jgi:predicted TIM-barrel fold metal-dependent hydrolase